jgi:hypothetical protein
MNKNILLLLFILLIPIVFSYNEINITTLPICKDDTTVKLISRLNFTEGELSIKNCELINLSNNQMIWKCDCKYGNIITIESINGTNNMFNAVITYNVISLSDIYKQNYSESRLQIEYESRKRVLRFYDIKIGKPDVNTNPFYELIEGLKNDEDSFKFYMWMLFFIGIVFLIGIGIGIYVLINTFIREK